MNQDESFRRINRQLVLVYVLGAPGLVLLGLGLYALIGAASGELVHPILNDKKVVYACFIAGGALQVWQAWRVLKLRRERLRLSGAMALD